MCLTRPKPNSASQPFASKHTLDPLFLLTSLPKFFQNDLWPPSASGDVSPTCIFDVSLLPFAPDALAKAPLMALHMAVASHTQPPLSLEPLLVFLPLSASLPPPPPPPRAEGKLTLPTVLGREHVAYVIPPPGHSHWFRVST